MVVGIIGAGASGMAAAISAAENPNVQVRLYERQARVGKKLMATGNGRCNLSNCKMGVEFYHGEDPSFVEEALNQVDVLTLRAWFYDLGLHMVADDNKIYPFSDQANSVVDVLRLALVKENITLLAGAEVTKIRQEKDGFVINDTDFCDRLIIACGGLAGTKLGGSMWGYKLLSKLGHKSTRLRPSLVQLKCDWPGVTALKGVRCQCNITIQRDGECFARSGGELQFTEYGLSGPVVFRVSRDVCHGSGNWTAVLDLMPRILSDEFTQLLEKRRERKLPMDELFTGILHNRLGRVLTKAAGVTGSNTEMLTDHEIQELIKTVKHFEINLTEPMGMDHAQVTAGGVLTADFDPNTMESCLIPGLYACGEVLDIDGDCGGYNLHWAWASGIMAGRNAGKE
ncbi:MAG: aminoacetone oxidase family FAD-binding enzyme [Oscillospiraceae bacterium]|nr:aminoacetone oxidase family FAD-binding enzyme [Oscillospiraceae bacterium]